MRENDDMRKRASDVLQAIVPSTSSCTITRPATQKVSSHIDLKTVINTLRRSGGGNFVVNANGSIDISISE